MPGLNRLVLLGQVAQDPEIKQYNGGQLAKLSVATTEKRKDKSGQWIEETEVHNEITFFGQTVNTIAQFVKRGTWVYLECRLKTDNYNDKQGNPRSAVKIMGVSMQMLGGSQRQQQAPNQGYQNNNQGYQNQGQGYQQRQSQPNQNQGYQQPPQQPHGQNPPNDFHDDFDQIPF